jgi:hypothetical protein
MPDSRPNFYHISERRMTAYAVFNPVMTWQKIQNGDLTQSGKNGQFIVVAVLSKLILFKQFLII